MRTKTPRPKRTVTPSTAIVFVIACLLVAEVRAQAPTPPAPVAKSPDLSGRAAPPVVIPALVFTIDVKWLGGSAYRMEKEVTSRIEQAVKTLPGVKQVHSTVVGSRAQTQVSFDVRTDASSTASALRARLDQIRTRLPHDASQPLIAWHREPPGAS